MAEVVEITINSDQSQENLRFYAGWGAIISVLGLALLILASTGNIATAIAFFFIVLGIALVLISISDPVLPLVVTTGTAAIVLGVITYGMFVALLNPIIIFGMVFVLAGGIIIYLAATRRMVP